MPNYNRIILFDFYRFNPSEIEFLLQSFIVPSHRTGLQAYCTPQTHLYYEDWFESDRDSTQCLDAILSLPIIQSATWQDRTSNIRFYLTALWALCFEVKHSSQKNQFEPCAEFELIEFNKRLAIRLIFESHEFALKKVMDYLWPCNLHDHQVMNELVRHSDFIRVNHFPESHQIEITAFLIPAAPSIHYPNEVRGLWIEPLKKHYLKKNEEQTVAKRVPIQTTNKLQIANWMRSMTVAEMESMIQALEKSVAEKKKVA